ncbi:MAG: hypothetical protein LWX83_03450 [Anaerolineae bacterium]|nr:hypothetical protein [Anaerolineae bacterium]
MNKSSSLLSMDEKLAEVMRTPPPRPEFAAALKQHLLSEGIYAPRPVQSPRKSAWGLALLLLLLICLSVVLSGPQKVLADINRWLAYIPGLGLVQPDAALRVLEKPVRLTRSGISVSVNSALTGAGQTRVEYGISGLPLTAYPAGEINSGCAQQPYLLLPDGSQRSVNNNETLPATVNDVFLVLPCLPDTLPGSAPTDWRLPLHFVPLPAETTLLPVIELSPTFASTASPAAQKTAESAQPTPAAVGFDKYIKTNDGYILIGRFISGLRSDQRLQLTSALLRAARGKTVEILPADDIDPASNALLLSPNDFNFVYRIKAAGLVFPLFLSFSGPVFDAVPGAAEIVFDAGHKPQAGQEWLLNQEIGIGRSTIKLVSIQAGENVYFFNFEPDPLFDGPGVSIEGYQALGGGGGSHNKSLVYNTLPTGSLKLIFSNLYKKSGSSTWTGHWQPDGIPTEWPTPPPSQACYSNETLSSIPDLPDGLDGWVLHTELNPHMRLVLSGMHAEAFAGVQNDAPRPLTIMNANRGALTFDGHWLVYMNEAGLNLLDTTNGESSLLLKVEGYGPRWSPDGTRIVYIGTGGAAGLYITGRDGSAPRQLSGLGYESIAGWSPDGSLVYYAVPDAANLGFMLRSVNINSNETRDVILLDDSSRKAPMPAVSPDGQWVVYRGSDNNSLYIKPLNGGSARLLLDKPGLAITGLTWEKQGHLLGFSLVKENAGSSETFLMQVDNCETYRLPFIQGEINALYIP